MAILYTIASEGRCYVYGCSGVVALDLVVAILYTIAFEGSCYVYGCSYYICTIASEGSFYVFGCSGDAALAIVPIRFDCHYWKFPPLLLF